MVDGIKNLQNVCGYTVASLIFVLVLLFYFFALHQDVEGGINSTLLLIADIMAL